MVQVEWSRHSAGPQSLLTKTRALLRQHAFRVRKRLGQNFLINEEVLDLIISTAEPSTTDVIIEVGPGLGVLTRELVKRAGWVIAVELDDKLAGILKKNFDSFDNIAIVNKDILSINLEALMQEQKDKIIHRISSPLSYKVVANLPYYVTSSVLRRFLEAKAKPQTMVLMLQKEVAEAIAAGPGDMSLLSVSVQFYGKPKVISYVPAQSFYPVPDVDSAILRIDLYSELAVPVDEKSFFNLVRAGFGTPRKQISNSLSLGLGISKPEVLSLLDKASIVSQRRAESLSLEEWARLWQVLYAANERADS